MFEVAVVEDGRAHGDDDEGLDWLLDALDLGGAEIGRGVTAEDGDVAFAEPGGGGGVESCALGHGPGALFSSAGKTAGADEDNVAEADAGLLFPDVEVFGVDGVIYFMPVSLDGFIVGEGGNPAWSVPDDEVFAFLNELVRPFGTYLYGRKMYEPIPGR